MKVPFKLVKALKERTGQPLSVCKEALIAAALDLALAESLVHESVSPVTVIEAGSDANLRAASVPPGTQGPPAALLQPTAAQADPAAPTAALGLFDGMALALPAASAPSEAVQPSVELAPVPAAEESAQLLAFLRGPEAPPAPPSTPPAAQDLFSGMSLATPPAALTSAQPAATSAQPAAMLAAASPSLLTGLSGSEPDGALAAAQASVDEARREEADASAQAQQAEAAAAHSRLARQAAEGTGAGGGGARRCQACSGAEPMRGDGGGGGGARGQRTL